MEVVNVTMLFYFGLLNYEVIFAFCKNVTIFVMSNITQRWGNLPLRSGHFFCLLTPYGGSEPPCGVLMHPQPLKVLDNGTGGTVFFRPNL